VFRLNLKTTRGIDLAAKTENPTGVTVLQNKLMKTSLVFTDSEISEEIGNSNPALVAIDCLLGFPDRDFEKV
jgi:hypothetical protein